jgi:spore coat protein U-like protein
MRRAKRTKLPFLLAGIAAAALLAPALRAETTSAPFEVSAVVVSNCRLTVAPLVFGEYDPNGAHSGAPLDASSEFQLSCSRNSIVTISLDEGVHGTAPSVRMMAGGTERLAYDVYRDSSRTLRWGEGAEALVISEPGSDERVTLFGRVAGAQPALPGSYGDVVTARVDF